MNPIAAMKMNAIPLKVGGSATLTYDIVIYSPITRISAFNTVGVIFLQSIRCF